MSSISIALCTYNGAKFLPAQLESFLAQTRLPDELIICDDCSTDATPQIAKEFARRASFPVFLYLNEINLGSTKNFERAVSLCTGDLIFLSDQDDVWLPPKLSKFAAEFESSKNIGMVFSDAELVGESLESLGHRLWDFSFVPAERQAARNGKILEVLIKRNVVTGSTMAFRAAFRQAFLPIPTGIPNTIHDAWIALVIAANAEISFIEENLILYRQHPDQQLGIDWKLSEKIKQTTRRKRYAESIGFERKERERLIALTKVTENHPQFQSRDTKALIDILTETFMKESAQKILHYEARVNLPANRLKRIAPIAGELFTGRYQRFSRGLASAAKDVFETW